MLGDKVRDQISGFTGIAVAITYWLNGCVRITIAPQKLADGRVVDSMTFDQEQVEIIKPAAMSAPTSVHGGPRIEPVRHASPTR